MEFHSEFFPKPFSKKIAHNEKLMLIGSCFTEQIGKKLAQHKFTTLENPNGILFNPASISTSIISYIDHKKYTAEDLFYFNELWTSWQHHSRFSGIDKEKVLAEINLSQNTAHEFLKTSDWLMITLGSAFVYSLFPTSTKKDGVIKEKEMPVVANCHKVPTDKFNRRLLDAQEVKNILCGMTEKLKAFNPGIKIIFTISPVRHLREGFIENNRSKAALIQAVHSLTKDENIFYFPAYELIIDDLRDYRFYAEDMVHPNYAATNYVWEKFVPAVIDEASQKLMKEINEINAAMNHKPFNPQSEAHKKFLKANLDKIHTLRSRYPYLNLKVEENFFI